MSLDAHLFICTRSKEGDEACGNLGSEELRMQLKEKFKQHPELKGKVRINSSGCLGQCSKGIACVLYPQGEWIFHAKKDQAEELYKMVLSKVGKI